MWKFLIFASLLALSPCSLAEEGPKVDLENKSAEEKPLMCYVCNSATDAKCLGKMEGDTLVLDDTIEKKECNKDPKDGGKFKVCRKIEQNVRDTHTVIRSCGEKLWKNETETCYKTLHQEYNTLVCTCKGDGDNQLCNGAQGLSLSLLAVVATVMAAFMAAK